MVSLEQIKAAVRDVPDFPKPGILFKDITTVLKDAELFAGVIDHLSARYENRGVAYVVGIESRGFIFASALACRLGAGFVPIRKPGKLPCETHKASYELEYGSDSIEIHRDAVEEGATVLLIDDLLATGGTAAAATELLETCGAKVAEAVFLIELDFLEGRKKLGDRSVYSMIHY